MLKNIKKRLLSGVIIGTFILLPGMKGKAEFKGMDDVVFNTREVKVYNRDNFESEIIGTLNINQELYRILSGDNCDLINYNNLLGFVDKSSLQCYSFPNSERSYQEITEFGYTMSDVNIRSGPSIESDKIKVLPEGTEIELMALSDNGWYLVLCNNLVGFISKDHVKVIDFTKLEKQTSNLPRIFKAVVATTDVNIRENSDINSNKLGLLKEGQKLLMVERLNNGWIKVTNNVNVGYVCSDYVKECYGIEGNYKKQVYMKKDTLAYNYPYGTVIGSLPQYETCFVYGETDDFYLIESEGRVGYIKKIDTDELNNGYIVVDISDQRMTLYDGIEEVLTSKVVTGKNSTPTDIGKFSIYSKDTDRILKGDDYETLVKYWMAYNGGEGLHDAYWRHKFGGEIYKNDGSHGCVNLPTKVAKELYSNINIGDKVLVKR